MESKSGTENLWDLGIQLHSQTSGDSSNDGRHTLILGSKESGKTTLVLRFLDKSEAPKPTTALEYTFGRRNKGPNSSVKDVAHIWELGGGVSLAKLMEVPLSADNILNTSVVLCLDLSSPNEIWVVAEGLIDALSAQVKQCLTERARKQSDTWDCVKTSIKERLGGQHEDNDLMEPFSIPLVIVGTKYDLYQQFDPEKKKIIAKTLRFLAHTYGASLYFCSSKIESSITKIRGVFSSLAFGSQTGRNIQLDHGKPLIIPAGTDSFQSIGSPPIAEDDIGAMNARTPLDLWKMAFVKAFPQSLKGRQTEDPTKNVQYSEPVIDKCRVEKDKELERYRKASERKMRELERNAELEV